MKKSGWIVLFLLCFSGQHGLFAQNKLNAYFDHLFHHQKFMGSVSISFQDSIIYAKSVGYAEVDSKKEMNQNTRIRIGSITKTFTAVLVLKAVEENQLKLSDPLSKWFPEFKNAEKINIEMMLKHRTGIFNFTEIPGETQWEENYHTQQEFINYVINQPSNFAPGTDFEYSNTNYALLGFILERVYKKDFNTLLQEKIAKPLALANTCYSIETGKAESEAYSYNIQNNFIRNQRINYSNHPASGGMLSTAVELNRFLSALFAGKIISQENLSLMLPQERGTYGLGIEKLNFTNQDVYEHSGRIENYISDYWYFPNEKLGLVVLANAVNIDTDDILMTLLQFAYGKQPELPDFDKIDGMSKEEFAHIKGTYFNESGSQSITISSDGKVMVFQDSRAGQMYVPFNYKGENKFEYEDIVLIFTPAKNEVVLEQAGQKVIFTKR